jgi:hypothetical protein
MKPKTNYNGLLIIIAVLVIIGIACYFGASQLQSVHMDNSPLITKNITVFEKEIVTRQYKITDTDNVTYFTSEKNDVALKVGKNYTVTVSTINNNSGYWILTTTEIKPIKVVK